MGPRHVQNQRRTRLLVVLEMQVAMELYVVTDAMAHTGCKAVSGAALPSNPAHGLNGQEASFHLSLP